MKGTSLYSAIFYQILITLLLKVFTNAQCSVFAKCFLITSLKVINLSLAISPHSNAISF